MMELQLKHRIERMLAEERIYLERHEQELAVRRARVLYLESVTSEDRNGLTGDRSYHRCQDGRPGGRRTRESLGELTDALTET